MFRCSQLLSCRKFMVKGHAKISSSSKVTGCAENSSFSNSDIQTENGRSQCFTPQKCPMKIQCRVHSVYSWTFHWEHVTGNNILDKHRPILTASTCLKTSDLPPGIPLSCNCQLPPAGSAPHCSRGGQSIYKFLRLWWLPPKQRIVSICNCGGDFLKDAFGKLT